ncbi:phage distal tail protein [Curtobacterium sp. VKM Ac-1376]|uniref:phage distal tail protein n=1 Tax=Curtobacterium sp. VKM Ac-1376 TaxID=123312 RepID=UPI00188C1A1C|nr:hypothetical protein [Curtobacterium sp. VKM Ac-1376]MBF4613744.1 hypothetical protein [Curtobacterium sp. VKM Ac-1376]
MAQNTIDGNGDGTFIIDGNGDGSFIIDGNGLQGADAFPEPPAPPRELRSFWLESLDGSVIVPLSGTNGRALMPGATGLGLPPVDVVTGTTPGMPGSWLQEVNVLERPIFLPLTFFSWESQAEFFEMLAELRSVATDWDADLLGLNGTFRLGVASADGDRLLDVTYRSGWEGVLGGGDGGSDWEKFALNLVAVAPFWRARDATTQSYSAAPGTVFLGDGNDTHPWPRQISASVTVGSNMPILVDGDVPVWPEFTFTGPIPSVTISYQGTLISVPAGVPTGQTLRLVTDPRARSARLDGVIAWDRISMGATFSPLRPGVNLVSIQLATAGEDAAVDMSWFTQWKAAW